MYGNNNRYKRGCGLIGGGGGGTCSRIINESDTEMRARVGAGPGTRSDRYHRLFFGDAVGTKTETPFIDRFRTKVADVSKTIEKTDSNPRQIVHALRSSFCTDGHCGTFGNAQKGACGNMPVHRLFWGGGEIAIDAIDVRSIAIGIADDF